MDKDPESYNVRAIERAMQILLSFDFDHAERGVSEVAQVTGLHKATAHRIIMTLLNYGFLERSADKEKFRLGLRMVELGLGALRRLDFRQAAYPYMQQLVDRFHESCDLGIINHGQVLYLEVVHGTQALTIASRVGRHLPVHCTASGKVLLAFLPADVVDELLSQPLAAVGPNTTTSPLRLRDELAAIRRQGYAVDNEELAEGIRAVAAPIRDMDGRPIAAMSMPGPTQRITPERVPELATALVEATNEVSAHILHQ